jgi:hypothetical protein
MVKENLDRRMIPYGIDLNTIPMEETKCKVIIPINEPTPLATIPPKPHSYGSSYYAQLVLTAPSKPFLLEGAPLKGPIVSLPTRTKLMPPKHNEVLLGVETNKSGEIICAKYRTREHTYFEGVHAHPTKVKFIPSKEAPKRAMIASKTPCKHRKTMADIGKELAEQRTIIASLEAC